MSSYDLLNPEQKEAVLHTEGPLLILAGAGSGKTRVLTHRVAYLIEQGVAPWNILAITFTNKAAGEMRERVDKLVGLGSDSIWVSTFHSTCVRILRRYIDRLGYDTSFSIYDTDDQKSVMKEVCKKLQIDTKIYKERMLLGAISHAKDELMNPVQMQLDAGSDWNQQKIAGVYAEYQAQLHKNNALDFDDLIMKTVELFQNCPDVLDFYQERFRYIMVDEYQDTNTAQFKLVSLLAAKYRNLCVVGDDDQSIYRFRGANIMNILNFEQVFPDAKVIKLEQNYRSTSNILNAANEVIHHNQGRKDKRLWTDNDAGVPVRFRQFQNAFEEAEHVIGNITSHIQKEEAEYKDHAILYRTNAQSRLFEEKLIYANIPYKIIGGVNFYARKEIKDLLAYLKTVDNGRDEVAVRRIINVPKRGIGATTLSRVGEYAVANDMGFYEALLNAEQIPGIGRGASKVLPFTVLIQTLRAKQEHAKVSELLETILEETGYRRELILEGTDESEARLENIDELMSKVKDYDENAENPSLSGFLEEVALVADIDNLEEESNHVVLMTLHSAKGLEFPYVYMVGMEEGLFPSYMSIVADNPQEEIEEERRLCYVGITRAKKELTMTAARQRMLRGEVQYNMISRFVKEIPDEYLENKTESPGQRAKEAKEQRINQRRQAMLEARKSLRTKPIQSKMVAATKASHLDYSVGDRVKHIRFGEGTVLEIIEGAKDYEVRVNFDVAGVKKLFASFAKLQKVY
ncbi:DNA helicase PcrA [Laedolimicola sp.]|uniref:DNA helicase PcrA n=1 Tax=Laedolimicola sp. TaxID=2981663 RepID=UPI003F8065C8